MFKALVLEENGRQGRRRGRGAGGRASLPAGDVTVAVEYSTLNYKDGLVLRRPGTAGAAISACARHRFRRARVEPPIDPEWREGDAVVLTGWRVGETHWGGYAQKARVKGEWLVALPAQGSTTRARHGDRHRGLHRHAGSHGAGASMG